MRARSNRELRWKRPPQAEAPDPDPDPDPEATSASAHGGAGPTIFARRYGAPKSPSYESLMQGNVSPSVQANDELLAIMPFAGRAGTHAHGWVEHLVEIDRRRLYLEVACGSLSADCIERLGYAEDEASKRGRATRLARRFPAVLDELRAGRIDLSGLVVSPALTDETKQRCCSKRAARRNAKSSSSLHAAPRDPTCRRRSSRNRSSSIRPLIRWPARTPRSAPGRIDLVNRRKHPRSQRVRSNRSLSSVGPCSSPRAPTSAKHSSAASSF